MKKTLVLVVDRDDDFGVKGKVNTPVIGVQNCLDPRCGHSLRNSRPGGL